MTTPLIEASQRAKIFNAPELGGNPEPPVRYYTVTYYQDRLVFVYVYIVLSSKGGRQSKTALVGKEYIYFNNCHNIKLVFERSCFGVP